MLCRRSCLLAADPGEGERVLALVGDRRRVRREDVGEAEHLRRVIEHLAAVVEGHGGVMRKTQTQKDVAVEAGEVGNLKDSDAAEAHGIEIDDLALRHVAGQIVVRCPLQAEDRCRAGAKLAFQGTAGDVGRVATFHQTIHDELVGHSAALHLAGRGIAAMETHPEVARIEVAAELGQQIGRGGVVDVQQGRWCEARELAHILADRAVDVHFASDGNAALGEAAVDVAGDEAEFGLEGRPALVGHHGIVAHAEVGVEEAGQCQFVTGQLGQQVGVGVTLAQFGSHVFGDHCDFRIVLIDGFVEPQEVELAVLHDLDAEVVDRLNRRVAGQEVLGPRAESEDLEAFHAEGDAGDLDEVGDLNRQFVRQAHGILRGVDALPAQSEIVVRVQHATEGIATTLDQGVHALFGGATDHDGATELFGEEGQWAFGAEVAEIDRDRVGAEIMRLFEDRCDIAFALDDRGERGGMVATGFGQLAETGPGQFDREAIPADANDAEINGGGV